MNEYCDCISCRTYLNFPNMKANTIFTHFSEGCINHAISDATLKAILYELREKERKKIKTKLNFIKEDIKIVYIAFMTINFFLFWFFIRKKKRIIYNVWIVSRCEDRKIIKCCFISRYRIVYEMLLLLFWFSDEKKIDKPRFDSIYYDYTNVVICISITRNLVVLFWYTFVFFASHLREMNFFFKSLVCLKSKVLCRVCTIYNSNEFANDRNLKYVKYFEQFVGVMLLPQYKYHNILSCLSWIFQQQYQSGFHLNKCHRMGHITIKVINQNSDFTNFMTNQIVSFSPFSWPS